MFTAIQQIKVSGKYIIHLLILHARLYIPPSTFGSYSICDDGGDDDHVCVPDVDACGLDVGAHDGVYDQGATW